VCLEGFNLDFLSSLRIPHLDWDLAMAGLGHGVRSFDFLSCCPGGTGNQLNVDMHVVRVIT
jgi:hypothetical protein